MTTETLPHWSGLDIRARHHFVLEIGVAEGGPKCLVTCRANTFLTGTPGTMCTGARWFMARSGVSCQEELSKGSEVPGLGGQTVSSLCQVLRRPTLC